MLARRPLLLLAAAAAEVAADEQQPGGSGSHVNGGLALSVSAAGAVTSLGPANQTNFSFATAGFGALTLRTRPAAAAGGGAWSEATFGAGKGSPKDAPAPIVPLPAGEWAAAEASAGAHLSVEQHWAPATDAAGGVRLWYTLRNNGSAPLELGGLAVSMPANEQTGGNLETLAQTASFADPYIGGDHGHLTMTRLTGRDGVLMILGENSTGMEAFSDQWDPHAISTVKNAWVVHGKAFSEVEWAAAAGSWVNATSVTIPAGGSITRSFRIILAENGVQEKNAALRAADRPLLVSVPGYVVATDMTTAALFVQPPAAVTVTGATVVNDATPSAPPCMSVGAAKAPNKAGWIELPLTPTTPHCRCRVELRYSDGSFQVASYYVLPGLDKHLATFGNFQANTAFFDDDTDPFGRSPSVMPWNRKENKHVLHDPRNFIVGLSDEGGAGANVGFAIKQGFCPVQEELAQLDRYINSTLYGIHCPAAPPEYRSDCSLQDRATNGEYLPVHSPV